ncbi:hypothetical protein CesoFtcFv8_003955 [Champsocephalus esox]|uniref:Uncharacterized protein n=1 Tax=Champsocephalus esox TaxID=159716 RepID=A0AAN8HC20_9TELE|nr:hypothetical protein CesoFtcFv8_003955 [Champsocephalus esox]
MKGVQPARVADINFYGDKPKEKVVANNVPARRADPQPVSSDGFEDFLVSLLAASNPVMPVGLSRFSSTSSNFAPKKAVYPHRKSLQGCGPFTEVWRVSIPLMRCTVPPHKL